MGQSPKPLNPSKAEVACYAADMLASLRRLSEDGGMPLLAHLVDLARAEAVRNAQAYAEGGQRPAPTIRR